ncbi:hypothetical protein F0562_011587 [Nyssa sinensis]|uniref:Uncharacterized protein n=1 Tax=Nyssa sinensis TaxID=561372 RepID=A0A5J4ZSU7_9ASTE|nr:hypothetical protein F0562_011587 [Nyssa sinensis]
MLRVWLPDPVQEAPCDFCSFKSGDFYGADPYRSIEGLSMRTVAIHISLSAISTTDQSLDRSARTIAQADASMKSDAASWDMEFCKDSKRLLARQSSPEPAPPEVAKTCLPRWQRRASRDGRAKPPELALLAKMAELRLQSQNKATGYGKARDTARVIAHGVSYGGDTQFPCSDGGMEEDALSSSSSMEVVKDKNENEIEIVNLEDKVEAPSLE